MCRRDLHWHQHYFHGAGPAAQDDLISLLDITPDDTPSVDIDCSYMTQARAEDAALTTQLIILTQ